MIKFKRRKLQCWIGTSGYVSDEQCVISDIFFKDEEELLSWIKETLTFTSGVFPLEITDNSVIWGGVIGWIEVVPARVITDIQAEKARLDEEQRKLDCELDYLQNTVCTHPNSTKLACCNTGNYDPSADRYWYQCQCPDCGLYWTEDQ
jgi:hypothetical protein